MSTILTIVTKQPKTRITFNNPLRRISKIQLVDYDFPDTYVSFSYDQSIKDFNDPTKKVLTIPAGKYTLKELRYVISMSDGGIELYSNLDLTNRGVDKATVSRELSTKLGIPARISKGKYYTITWPYHKYHVYLDVNASKSILGLMVKKVTAKLQTS